MKRVLKWIGIIFASLILIGLAVGWYIHEPLPEGKSGPEADRLAREMLAAVDGEAWDSTKIVAWSFAGMHHYLWDRERHLVRVRWDEEEVLLDPDNISGLAYSGGEMVDSSRNRQLVERAWKYFCNDSFWLNAPAKVFDPGTVRELIETEDGRKGLLVRYTSGGVTPGDSYLWVLGEDGLPQYWRMWASIVPVGGIRSTWQGWEELYSGAKIATRHQTGFYTLEITGLDSAGSWSGMGLDDDPFLALVD